MLKPIKSLGQNFLRDENILRKIADSLRLQKSDIVLEIGPGHGALTKYLTHQCSSVIVVEIDERALPALREQFGETITIIHDDIVKVDLNSIAKEYGKKLHVVGNIPYYLTSDILFSLFEQRHGIVDATLMMQWEVSRRLIAKPKTKEYGILSVFTQLYAECEHLFKVSRNVFHPRPEVDSAVVRLTMREALPAVDEQLLRKIVRATFGKRRKTLRNGLKTLGIESDLSSTLSCDLDRRPEELSVDDFIVLTDALGKNPEILKTIAAHA